VGVLDLVGPQGAVLLAHADFRGMRELKKSPRPEIRKGSTEQDRGLRQPSETPFRSRGKALISVGLGLILVLLLVWFRRRL